MSARKTTKGAVPRKHHIIPAFYLAGFTRNETKIDRLNIFDCTSGRKYVSTPLKACRETDYNKVEEPGFDANKTEHSLSELEGDLAASVQLVGSGEIAGRLVGSGEIAGRPAIAQTLEFAALCAARNRRARLQMGPVLATGIASRLRSGEMSYDQWEQLRASELGNGARPDQVPAYSVARQLLADRSWFPRAPLVLQVGLVFEAAHGLYKTLMKKRWETHVTNPSVNGGFICSGNLWCGAI